MSKAGFTAPGKPGFEGVLQVAESLRNLLSRWVRTTREHAGTPTSAKVETLRLLQDAGPLSITALAERRMVKHQSMRLIVEQLAVEEAVIKAVDPKDRRNQSVRITAKGRAAVKQDQKTRTEWIATVLETCSASELDRVALAVEMLEDLLSRSSSGKAR